MTLSDTHDHGAIKKYPLPARKRLLARVSSRDAFLARLKLAEGHISFKFWNLPHQPVQFVMPWACLSEAPCQRVSLHSIFRLLFPWKFAVFTNVGAKSIRAIQSGGWWFELLDRPWPIKLSSLYTLVISSAIAKNPTMLWLLKSVLERKMDQNVG